MSALAGVWHFDGRPDAVDRCARMLASQELYGPHAVASWSDTGLALGRCLMRTLPEDAFDRQPLSSGGSRYVLVADIRLDNRDELIKALQIPAADAKILCDAALLLAAIERWDESCLGRIVGDYAFALWDGTRRRLLLARDPLGQRPLHYHRGSKFVAFASMPKGLHALSEIPYAPDENRIAEFLVLMPETGVQSFFHGVERVEPGQLITVTATGLIARQHWQPSRCRIALRRSEDYSEAVRDLLDQAVRCRLRGAENVGAYLSGGLDGGAVAATAARWLAPSGGWVVAFTAVPRKGYDNAAPRNRIVDEGPYAAATAALYGNIEHVMIRSEGRSPLDDLDRNFRLFDQPALNLCNMVWGNSIRDAAKERKLTVMLTGQMGNISLSYDGLQLLPELFRHGQLMQWWKQASALVKGKMYRHQTAARMRWSGVAAQTLGPWCPAPLWIWLNRIYNGSALDVGSHSAVHPRRFRELELAARARERDLDLAYRPWKDGFAMRLWVARGSDPGNYNKGVLGGWQIDERDPTADVRLLEFCLAIPTEQFLHDGVQRALARRALEDRLPKLVLDEPRKGLQAADWHEHLMPARIADELDRLEACSPAARAIDVPRLRRLVKDWPTGGWERDEVSNPYRYALLRAISAGHFLRRATGANA